MGRPTKLTPELQDKVVTAIRAGNYAEVSAAFAGISESCYYAWVKRGKDEIARRAAGAGPKRAETPFVEFAEAVETAKAAAEVRAVTLIMQAAQDSWQAAAWFLERTRPGRYSRTTRTEVTGAAGAPVAVEVSAEDLDKRLAALIASTAAQESEDSE